MTAEHEKTGKTIADKLVVARTVFARMKGLLGRDSFVEGEGLLLRPCMGIHTFGMKFPIDVIFLDKDNRVVTTRENMAANRMSSVHFSATGVLELPAGTLTGLRIAVGDRVVID